jgi:MFS family permease
VTATPALPAPISARARGSRTAFRWTAYVLAVTSFAAGVPTPFYPSYEERFGFSAGVLGAVFGAYALGVLLTLLLVAPLAEEVGRRKLLYLAMALTGLGALLFAFATGVVSLTLARVVTGMAVGATSSVATAAMTDLEPYRDQHHVARVAVAANFGGFAVGVTFSALWDQYGADPSQLVYLLPIVASLVGALAIRGLPETATAFGSKAPVRIQRPSVPSELRRPFWVAAGGIAACYAIYGFFAALVPSYVRSGLGIDSPLIGGSIVALLFGAAALTQLTTGQVRDRRALLVGFPLLLITLVALVLTLPRSSWVGLVVVTAGMGVAVGMTFMGAVTLVDRVVPESQRGELLAAFYCTGYIALAIPTLAVAEASEKVGISDAGILLGSVLAVAVAILYLGILRTPTPSGGGGRPRGPPGPAGGYGDAGFPSESK